jgi:MOSC domain-containing protein YiiM
MANNGRIEQLSISKGGVPKLPVQEAVVGELGLEGDVQRDKKHHGGPDRALCLYALEVIQSLQAEGHPIQPGNTGENVTISGIDWEQVVPGVRLQLGAGVLVEVTSYTAPCDNNVAYFKDGDFMRMSQKLHPGWSRVYARVLSGGTLRPGDEVELVEAGAATGKSA